MEITNEKGFTSTIQRGCKKKHKDFPEDTVIIPLEFRLYISDLRMGDDAKELAQEKQISEEEAKKQVKKSYYVKLTYLAILPGEHDPILCHSNESSHEIVEFYTLVKRGAAKLNQRLHLGMDGNKIFYKEYHVTAKDAVEYLKTVDGIKELIY